MISIYMSKYAICVRFVCEVLRTPTVITSQLDYSNLGPAGGADVKSKLVDTRGTMRRVCVERGPT